MSILHCNGKRMDPAEEQGPGATFSVSGSCFASPISYPSMSPDEETRHLAECATLTWYTTARLLKVSRGPVVDEKALVEALRQKKIAGAGLDVYEYEPALTPGLTELDNKVLLRHVGSATVDARIRMAEMAAENLLSTLRGEVPPNRVNPEALKRRPS